MSESSQVLRQLLPAHSSLVIQTCPLQMAVAAVQMSEEKKLSSQLDAKAETASRRPKQSAEHAADDRPAQVHRTAVSVGPSGCRGPSLPHSASFPLTSAPLQLPSEEDRDAAGQTAKEVQSNFSTKIFLNFPWAQHHCLKLPWTNTSMCTHAQSCRCSHAQFLQEQH